jgi:hypothetical protein
MFADDDDHDLTVAAISLRPFGPTQLDEDHTPQCK